MNDGLVDAFRHNAWATGELLSACQGLTEDQLNATVTGTYGSIIATLRHIVSSEAGYYARLAGEEPAWDRHAEESWDVVQMQGYADDMAQRWECFLEEPFDAERTFLIKWHDGIDRDVPAGVVLGQVLHHGNEHRSQVATILTTIGVTPPEWGLWEWAEATNRARPRSS